MIAIKRRDGGYSWMWLASETVEIVQKETEDGEIVEEEKRTAVDPDAEVEKWKSVHGADYVSHEIIDDASAPQDWNLIEAWEPDKGRVVVNALKAREFCHKVRRQFRDHEFEPLDARIAKQIPGDSVEEIEAQRAAVRARYDVLQQALDVAATPEKMAELMIAARPATLVVGG